MTTPMNVTEDERALIDQMRLWSDGVPDGALGQGKLSGVYLSLMAARAELYIMALCHGHHDLRERHERFQKLVSPHDIIKLVRAWEDLQHRIRDDEAADMVTEYCLKRTFQRPEDAVRAANRTSWANKKRGSDDKAHAYLCPKCGFYHVGRGARGNDLIGVELK